MTAKNSLTATNLAVHQHLNCDLYLYNTYHGTASGKTTSTGTASPPELTKAQYKRGLDWETRLYAWLDTAVLLLQVPSLHLDPDTLLENIFADDRSHFFITGLTFWPPQAQLNERFRQEGTTPFNFGLAKPDLLEIMRTDTGIMWRVLDVKASKNVKTSHHMQVYFYTLCLRYLLVPPFYHAAESTGIWLPAKEDALPSLDDIKYISLELSSQPFDNILFRELPKMMSLPRREVKWHYNPVCNGCPFETECRTNAQDEGRFGAMANISISDMIALKDLLRISRGGSFRELPITDIEELHDLIKDKGKLQDIAQASPSVVKKARQILALPKKVDHSTTLQSPLVEAARTREIQVINRRNYTCPRREDIAIFVYVVIDPSTSNMGGNTFCVTSHSQNPNIHLPSPVLASANNFVPSLANFIRTITTFHPLNHRGYTTQFYVWSFAEQHALQSHIINAALTSTHDIDDIQLCVGALSQGAALLQTAFQPLLLSGALLSFLGKGKRLKAEYVACLKRMGLPTDGTVEVLRKRIDTAVRRIQEEAAAESVSESDSGERRRKQFGQLPRVVVLKKEIERQLALPVPGYWNLPECVSTLLPRKHECPTDEQIFVASRASEDVDNLRTLLIRRHDIMYAVLKDFRARAVAAGGHSLLINEGSILSVNFMDLCRQPHIRKLFFMQQFEVLAKLTEAWQSRIEGCPDAPTLEYVKTAPGANGQQHVFRLLSGTVDVPPADRDHAFFDKLLVRDTLDLPNDDDDCERLSAEALFDDLAVSGLLFPLNQWTKLSWNKQDPRVQKDVMLADVRTMYTDQERLHTMVSLRTWGSGNIPLQRGATYRLSPRLVDFNTTKILSALFEIDLTWGSLDEEFADGPHHEDHHGVPFLQLIMDPTSLGKLAVTKDFVKTEGEIQRLFRDLKGLGNDIAGSLVLKPSQHRAAQRILSNRLSVVWGPPGTGKTYTISLSLLRLLEVERRHFGPRPKIVMITAITHAAVEACRNKLAKLMDAYRSIDSLPTKWLEDIKLEVVSRGSEHPAPKRSGNTMYIYAGTIYQLSNFMKRHSMEVDCVIIDEAGQISLGSISLVLRSLTADGRIIIAGDSEQLAPILSAQYPQLKDYALFGSVLDCLMFSQAQSKAEHAWPLSQTSDNEEPMSQGTVIQLTENFRLNPDLGEFVSTIYSRQFKPQKVQARELALALSTVLSQEDDRPGIDAMILTAVQTFLVSLSDVMFKQPQTVLVSPQVSSSVPAELLVGTNASALTHRPVSLAMIRLKTTSGLTQQIPYESHVHGEAAVAAALVNCIQMCCPHDDIFVATPHRIQREAVKSALAKIKTRKESPSLDEEFAEMSLGTTAKHKVTVDTVERLQGSEASFVICLFSLPKTFVSDLPFLLERRRLNVAISRAKTLCILITSEEVLRPGMRIFVDEETAKGYAFLKAFEKRAWSYNLSVNMDTLS